MPRSRPPPRGTPCIDLSVNGTWSTGSGSAGRHLLARADVIRIGHDEFRFYADRRRPQVPLPPRTGAAPEGGEASTRRPGRAPVVGHDARHAAAGAAAWPRRPRPEVPLPIASLLVRSGSMRGRRLPMRVPVVNIGRADYNDIVIADPSVSTTHAKLQRRDGIWMLTDLGSTNGTFVDGEQVTGETALTPGSDGAVRRGRHAVRAADDGRPTPPRTRTPRSSAGRRSRWPSSRPPTGRPPPRAVAERPGRRDPRGRSARPPRSRAGPPAWLIASR